VTRSDEVDGVAVFELARADAPLPDWTPGAHIDVILPSGLVRQYSLCGPVDAPTWQIAVLRDPESRGGSSWLFDVLEPGATLKVAGPRNHFEFAGTGGVPVRFIGGGIGITPLIPMATAAKAQGLDYEVHYAGRPGHRAFEAALRAEHGDRLVTHSSMEATRLDLAALVASSRVGTAVYCCGPASLIDDAERRSTMRGLDFHAERFEALELSAPVWDDVFEVELAASGVTVSVPQDRSILEVVEEAGVIALSSCSEGTCGTCETVVVEGEIDHRDSILNATQRARNEVMYICVSRAACPRIVLDL